MDKKDKPNKNNLVTRRDFLKFTAGIAAMLGVGHKTVLNALLQENRPPVIWLHFAECTGCTESILRTTSPWFDELIMNVLSLEYHETLMAGAGHSVETVLAEAVQKYSGEFFLVVEGAVPTANNGIYGMIGGKTMLQIAEEVCPQAKAIICCGTCSSYGGLPAAQPNPTGAKGLKDALPNLAVPVVNVPGCPPNPVNLIAVIADYLLNGSLPSLDKWGRPTFAYGSLIHRQCPYRRMFNKKRCVLDEGCKGQWTYNNCPSVKFNDGTSFPMQAGHPCIGCSEPSFWDNMTPFYK